MAHSGLTLDSEQNSKAQINDQVQKSNLQKTRKQLIKCIFLQNSQTCYKKQQQQKSKNKCLSNFKRRRLKD